MSCFVFALFSVRAARMKGISGFLKRQSVQNAKAKKC